MLKGDLPLALRKSAEMYAGCVSGAIEKDSYLNIIREAGFTSIKVQKERKITIPDEILSVYLDNRERENYASGDSGVYSVTVYAEKPVALKEEKEPCCGPGCCGK